MAPLFGKTKGTKAELAVLHESMAHVDRLTKEAKEKETQLAQAEEARQLNKIINDRLSSRSSVDLDAHKVGSPQRRLSASTGPFKSSFQSRHSAATSYVVREAVKRQDSWVSMGEVDLTNKLVKEKEASRKAQTEKGKGSPKETERLQSSGGTVRWDLLRAEVKSPNGLLNRHSSKDRLAEMQRESEQKKAALGVIVGDASENELLSDTATSADSPVSVITPMAIGAAKASAKVAGGQFVTHQENAALHAQAWTAHVAR